jgi:DKNYY family
MMITRTAIAALCVGAAATLAACSNEIIGGYFQRDGREYWSGGIDGSTSEVVGADTGSFHAFGMDYARDKAHVYFDGRPVDGADVSSFDDLTGDYARDKSRIYYRGAQLADADRATFSVLDGGYAKDVSHVWHHDKVISSDPAHFRTLDNGGGAKDTMSVFCPPDATVMSNDAEHFVILGTSRSAGVTGYTKDSHAVYFNCQPISGADPNSFHLLYEYGNCAADERHAYYLGLVIPNVDPRGFPAGKAVTGCTDTAVSFAR